MRHIPQFVVRALTSQFSSAILNLPEGSAGAYTELPSTPSLEYTPLSLPFIQAYIPSSQLLNTKQSSIAQGCNPYVKSTKIMKKSNYFEFILMKCAQLYNS